MLSLKLTCQVIFVSMVVAFESTSLVSLLIFPDADVSVYNCQKRSSDRSCENSDEAWRIDWRILRLEEQRTDKVA